MCRVGRLSVDLEVGVSFCTLSDCSWICQAAKVELGERMDVRDHWGSCKLTLYAERVVFSIFGGDDSQKSGTQRHCHIWPVHQ